MESVDKQYLMKVDDKGFVPDDARNALFRKLRMKNENRTCFECKARNPTWISLTYGVYVCLECSGEHRRKGVHISYVRSVEMDKFYPEQLVQMAVGGNARAWNYFKSHGMGKTSDAQRPVDYNSRITQRYKADIEKLTKDTCAQLGISKGGGAAETPIAASEKVPATEEPAAAEAPAEALEDEPSRATSTPSAVGVPQVPKAAVSSAPASVVIVRKAAPPAAVPAAQTLPSGAPKPSGFAGAKTKQMDFDFDFDELEAEVSKPKPKPAPAAAAGYTGAAAASSPVASGGYATGSRPAEAHQAVNGSSGGPTSTTSKFSNKKGISSDDFFGLEADESASGRMERESRYNKFAGSGQISSDAFFSDGAEVTTMR